MFASITECLRFCLVKNVYAVEDVSLLYKNLTNINISESKFANVPQKGFLQRKLYCYLL